MINLGDPLDRLRAANPVPAGQVTLTRPDPVLFRRIITEQPVAGAIRRGPAPARRRAKRWVPVLLVGGLLGGGAYALRRDEVTKPFNVECFERADLAADSVVVVVEGAGPVAVCAEVWRRGEFDSGTEAPALAECVLDSGVVGVFPTVPGADVCTLINLVPPASTTQPATRPPPTIADVGARILQFRDAVFPQLLDAPCVEPRVAAPTIRRELDRAGLSDWTIRGGEGRASDGFSAERPCVTLALSQETKEVVLVPSPRR